jgi:hypothetical protein
MWHRLRRHPLPIQAFFRHSLVLTYAYPRALLEPLLAPGLVLDTYGDFGFLAIALVQTEGLRPLGAPRLLGRNFFLSGYRIFSRFTTRAGRHLRGLRILRSDTDSRFMALAGNALTHYHYHVADVTLREEPTSLDIAVRSEKGHADLQVRADWSAPALLPAGSPFSTLDEARHFAGPLPFTFDYEKETHSLVVVKGVRKQWDPEPVHVDVRQNTFLQQEPFCRELPRLANAFHVANISYRWEKGRLEPLSHDRPGETQGETDEKRRDGTNELTPVNEMVKTPEKARSGQ